jgi:rubrerythrin
MAGKRMVKAHELEKSHTGHAQHLCELASKKQMNKIADLAKGAKYICHFCGRAAAKAENLCEAVEI